MAGFKIVTNLKADEAFKLARRAAKDRGFTVQRTEDDLGFSAAKGNLILSIFLGAIIAYCNFQVLVDEFDDGTSDVIIERNKPWWTGWLGLNRVKNAAKQLVETIADYIHENGGEVLSQKEIK